MDKTTVWENINYRFQKIWKPGVPDTLADKFGKNLIEPWNFPFIGKTTEMDIYYCFRLLLGRNPHKEEWPAHMHFRDQNLTSVVTDYLSSLEFKNRGLQIPKNDVEMVHLEGFDMVVSPSDIAVGKTIANSKTYENHVTKVIKDHLDKKMTFIDIGANIGYFSLLAAKIVGESGTILSFEPNIQNVKFLYYNIRLNSLKNVQIYPLALSDSERLWFYANTGSNGNISQIIDDFNLILSQDMVFSVALDNFIHSLDSLDMIKIDIEGAEYLALQGAKSTIKKHHPMIISEFTPIALQALSGVSGNDYLKFLIDNGYDLSVIDFNGDIRPFGEDIEGLMNDFQRQNTQHIDILCMYR